MEKEIDKRRYVRIPATIKVIYSIKDDPAKSDVEVSTNNIGEGGILLYVPKPLPISVQMELNLYSPRSTSPIKTKSKVVWVNEIKPNKLYEIGVAFTEIKESAGEKAIFMDNSDKIFKKIKEFTKAEDAVLLESRVPKKLISLLSK